ncbi:MAG: LysE family translocator [Candidatus Thalassarchaeum sp.]|tara:strand:+ start:22 stop:660 length:639 start_codon:yes stop_codon:yes gene_type:complete
MDTEIIAQLAGAGIALGIIEGIKPGPLLTMVIRESLSKGLKAGMWTAAAPIFTDGPMIIASLLLAGWMATQPSILFSISLLGALFLTKMGLECFSLEAPDPDNTDIDASGSFKRGIVTNLLNPHVYMFWFLIGGPLMASAAEQEPLAPILYAICFLITIILVKASIAWLFVGGGTWLSPRKYRVAMVICGLAMLGFAASFAYQAYGLYPEVL